MTGCFCFFSCSFHLFHLKRKALMWLLASFRASLNFWLTISQTSQLKSERQMATPRREAAEAAGSDCGEDRLPAPPWAGEGTCWAPRLPCGAPRPREHVPAGHGGGRGQRGRPAALQGAAEAAGHTHGLRGPQVPWSTETCGREQPSQPRFPQGTHLLAPRQHPHVPHGPATPSTADNEVTGVTPQHGGPASCKAPSGFQDTAMNRLTFR